VGNIENWPRATGIRQRSNDNRIQPFRAEAISFKDSIMRYDTQFLHSGLGDKHPVERVTMDVGQPTNADSVPETDHQRLKSASEDRLLEVLKLDLNSSQSRLDRDFPNRGRTDEDVVAGIGNNLPGLRRQPGVIGQPPQKDVGVEEQTHGLRFTFERGENFLWQRLVEILLDSQLAAQLSRPAHLPFGSVRNQSSDRFSGLGDDDFFAAGSFFDQPREMGLCLVNVDLTHN